MKHTNGFTLVELIVVIAILGILAGIAIPVYSGYIQKAHEAEELLNLNGIKTAAVFTYTQDKAAANETIGNVTKIEVEEDSCKVTDNLNEEVDLSANAGFISHCGQDGSVFSFTFKSDSTKATWENGTWTFE